MSAVMMKPVLRQGIRRLLQVSQRTTAADWNRVLASTKTRLMRYVSAPPQHRTMVVVTKTSASSQEEEEKVRMMDIPTTSSTALETAKPASSNDYSISITPSCAQRIRNLATKRNLSLDEMYLRVFVDAGGCSGFQYQFELLEDSQEPVEEEDRVFRNEDESGTVARVVVDEASLELIHGSTIDFVQEMIKSAFVVASNPQSESACGCGSSFAVKNFEVNPALD